MTKNSAAIGTFAHASQTNKKIKGERRLRSQNIFFSRFPIFTCVTIPNRLYYNFFVSQRYIHFIFINKDKHSASENNDQSRTSVSSKDVTGEMKVSKRVLKIYAICLVLFGSLNQVGLDECSM